MSRMGCLVGDPARHRSRCIAGSGEDAVGLHRSPSEALADHRDLGNHVGALERIDIRPVLRAEAHVRPVLGKQDRSIGHQALRRRHDRLHRFVARDNHLGGVGCLALRGRDHGSDDVTNKPDDLVGKDRSVHGLGHHRKPLERPQTQIIAPSMINRLHARHRLRIAHFDTQYFRVRLRRPHERDVQRAVQRQVIHVLAGAREQRRVLQSLNSVSQNRSCSSHGKPFDGSEVAQGGRDRSTTPASDYANPDPAFHRAALCTIRCHQSPSGELIYCSLRALSSSWLFDSIEAGGKAVRLCFPVGWSCVRRR